MIGRPRRMPGPIRAWLWVGIGLLGLALGGCQSELSRFCSVSCENIDGTPYLVVETAPLMTGDEISKGVFSIYKSTSADFSSWEAVVENRAGPVDGTFSYRGSQGSRLGLLHPGRVSLYNIGEQPDQPEFIKLPFNWRAETGAQIGEFLYLFGGEFPLDPKTKTYPLVSKLKVARFDGQKFEELNLASAPDLKRGTHGFWLKALTHQDRVLIFWRPAQETDSAGIEPGVSFTGSLSMATFDGLVFGGIVRQIDALPQGYTSVWSEGERLRAVIQPQERSFGQSAPLRIFTLPPSGPPEEERLSSREGPAKMSFKFFNVERIPVDGQEAFLRTNSQTFEVWRAGPESWSVLEKPQGLPENNFEQVLYVVLGLSVVVVALGLGMAYRRRRQLQLVVSKLKPSDVLAPLSLRVSAHLIDLGVLAIASEVLSWLLDWPSPGPLRYLFFDFNILGIYGAMYVVYLALAEWLTGATLGKWLLGLRVVTDKGERPTPWATLVRNLIGFFERHPVLAAFAALPTIFLTPRNQRLGDLMARTLVVHKTAMDRFRKQRMEEEEDRHRAQEEDWEEAELSRAPPKSGTKR